MKNANAREDKVVNDLAKDCKASVTMSGKPRKEQMSTLLAFLPMTLCPCKCVLDC